MNPLYFALQEYGLKEIVGGIHNPAIVKYFEESGHSWVKDDETAWCAAFVNAMLKRAGLVGTQKLNARSFLNWGTMTMTPAMGDIVVFWRTSISSANGHVAFFIKETKDLVYCLGGNQDNQIIISAYSKAQLLGYRKVPSQLSECKALSSYSIQEIVAEFQRRFQPI